MKIFVAVEGYQLKKKFVLKELHMLGESGEFKHFVFKQPLLLPDEADRQTIRYTTRYLSQLAWTDGDVPYTEIRSILQKLQHHTLYTYGYTSEKMLQEFLPTTPIVNTQRHGHRMPKELPKPNCFYHHRPRYCAMAKAQAVKQFIEENDI